MYRVYLNGKKKEILHDVRVGITLDNAVITRELNTVNSFVFSIYKNHPLYSAIKPMDNKTLISAYQDDDLMFLGRILKADGDNPKTVTCEGVLGYFNDVQVKFNGNLSVNDLLSKLIDSVNSKRLNKYGGNQNKTKFVKGDINVSSTTEITESSYRTPWEIITTNLIGVLGGYIRPRFLDDGNIAIDYVTDFDEICEQEVRIGLNISSKDIVENGQDIYTSIIPTTKYSESDSEVNVDLTSLNLISFDIVASGEIKTYYGSDTGEYVHIASSDAIFSKSAVEQYGIIQKTLELDKKLNNIDLAKSAIKTLSNNVFITKTYNYKIIDLSRLNLNLPSFREGKKIKLCDETNSTILCTKIIKNINNPTADEIELGATMKYLTKG